MTWQASTTRLLEWLGGRSRREALLLTASVSVVAAHLVFFQWIPSVWARYTESQIRYRASQASFARWQYLLENRQEILSRAQEALGDLTGKGDLQVSSLVVQRVEESRGPRTRVLSIQPMGGVDQPGSYRVELAGPPEEVAELLYRIGRAAPPMNLQELAISSDRASGRDVSAVAVIAAREESIPVQWIDLIRGASTDSVPAGTKTSGRVRVDAARAEGSSTSAGAPTRHPPTNSSHGRSTGGGGDPFPYRAIGRAGVFESRPPDTPGLGRSSPSIQSVVKGYTLVGVVGDTNPTAVILERETNHTHYRRAGEFIGELEVVEITRTSVRVRYQNEEDRLQ